MDIVVSAVVVASIVALAVQLGRRLVGPDFNRRPVVVGILAAVGFFAALFPINIWLRVDDVSYGLLLALGGWALVPVVAATVSWILAAPDAKTKSLLAALLPTLGLILIFNQLTEFLLVCFFGRSIYLSQLVDLAC